MAEWIILNNADYFYNTESAFRELNGKLYWGWQEGARDEDAIGKIQKNDIVYIYQSGNNENALLNMIRFKCKVIKPQVKLISEMENKVKKFDKRESIEGPYIELKILETYRKTAGLERGELEDHGWVLDSQRLLKEVEADLESHLKEQTTREDVIDKRFYHLGDIGTVDKNMILYGPPGTGKTYHTAIYAVAICRGIPADSPYGQVVKNYEELQKEGRVQFTTFHQSYGYEEFIEGIRPVIDDNKGDNNGDDESDNRGDIRYEIEPGVFKKFCDTARKNSNKNYVFIIDEINRGNISKIFGELITLIEDTKREGTGETVSAKLPYSGEGFSVPENVYILGTMNTADRSIALMDVALRRRFRFIELMPDPEVLDGIIVKGEEEQSQEEQGVDIAKMLQTINKRIEVLYDREHTIGHAFFTTLRENPTVEKLGEIFKNSVIPLLQEYFYEDYEKIQLVLGDNAKPDDKYKFINDKTVEPKSIFKGQPISEFDLPGKIYEINEEALREIKSYIQIYDCPKQN